MSTHSRNTECLRPWARGSMRWSSSPAKGNHQRPLIHQIRENSRSSHRMDISAPRVSPEQQQLTQHLQPYEIFDYGHVRLQSPEQHLDSHHVLPLAVPELKPASLVTSAQYFHSQHIPPTANICPSDPQKLPQHMQQFLSVAVSEYGNKPCESPEHHRRSAHVQPIEVFDYGHVQRSSPEQHLHSHHDFPYADPRISPDSRISSSQHFPSQHIPPTDNFPPRIPHKQPQRTQHVLMIAVSEHGNELHVSPEQLRVSNHLSQFTTLPDAPVPQVSPEQHILSQYAPPILVGNGSCLQFILAARTYAQMHVRIGIKETGKLFHIPPAVTTIPGSHLYNVTFFWGLTTTKTYSVNIADVGTIDKEYNDSHTAEAIRSNKPGAYYGRSHPFLRGRP